MKVNRQGRAKILTQSEIQQIFAIGLTNDRDRALFQLPSPIYRRGIEGEVSQGHKLYVIGIRFDF